MKKILSILICLVFGISSAWASDGYATIHAYALYDPQGDGTYELGGGTVQAFGQQKGMSSSDKYGNVAVYSTAQGKGNDWGFTAEKYKVEAYVKSTWDGYYFSGWYTSDGSIEVNTSTTPVTMTSSSVTTGNVTLSTTSETYSSGELRGNQNYGPYKVYAIFKPILDVPEILTSTTEHDIYTGTENIGSYPYYSKGKVKVDLSAAFNGGVASFDKLYIFGLTTGDANNNITVPTATTNSNAVTPCYIYRKSGDNYVFEAKIDNVNVPTKPAQFNITASGQKIYFTGYAPYASCGSTWEENGVFFSL